MRSFYSHALPNYIFEWNTENHLDKSLLRKNILRNSQERTVSGISAILRKKACGLLLSITEWTARHRARMILPHSSTLWMSGTQKTLSGKSAPCSKRKCRRGEGFPNDSTGSIVKKCVLAHTSRASGSARQTSFPRAAHPHGVLLCNRKFDEISYYIRNGAGRISLTRFWYHTKEF